MKVRIRRLRPSAILPQYATEGSAGMDLCADIDVPFPVQPKGRWAAVPTGIAASIPRGYEGQIRPRSGLALGRGMTVLNTPGTLDSDYRGEIQVVLINHGFEPMVIRPGDRIAQLVIAPVSRVEWEEVEVLEDSERGAAGFGSTGISGECSRGSREGKHQWGGPERNREVCVNCGATRVRKEASAEEPVETARTADEWHEDFGPVVWWTWRDGDWLGEPSYIGSPLCDDWPGYHTHWTPHPDFPAAPTAGGDDD